MNPPSDERPIRILVIDDDPAIRETYASILTSSEKDELLKEGASLFDDVTKKGSDVSNDEYELCLASRGSEGIEAVETAISENNPFSLAFIDMKMPGIDGAETVKKIWYLDPKIKIIFVTAYADFSPEEINKKTGRVNSFYLRKPFNPDEIKQFARALSREWLLDRERESLSISLWRENAELEIMNQDLVKQVEQHTAELMRSDGLIPADIVAGGIPQKIYVPLSLVYNNLSILEEYNRNISELLGRHEDLAELLQQPDASDFKKRFEEIWSLNQHIRFAAIVKTSGELITECLASLKRIGRMVKGVGMLAMTDDALSRGTDIHELINAAITEVQDSVSNELNIVRDFDGQVPEIVCVPGRLIRVFINILTNATQSFDQDGVITIKTVLHKNGKRQSDKNLRISIVDNGCGIAEDDLKNVFSPFYTTRSNDEGTGLGLNVCYNIIRFHGGDISVESQLDKGTTFFISLPLSSPFDVISGGNNTKTPPHS